MSEKEKDKEKPHFRIDKALTKFKVRSASIDEPSTPEPKSTKRRKE